MQEPFMGEKRSDLIYGAEKLNVNVTSGYRVYQAIRAAISSVVAGTFFIIIGKKYGIPPLVIVGYIVVPVFGLLMPLLSYWNRKKEMNALAGELSASAVMQPVSISEDEQIVDYVAGVRATGGHGATFVVGSAGALAAPENTIVITNKNVRFIYVPLPGADVTGSMTDVADWDYMLAQGDIDAKYKEILAEGGLAALVGTSTKNFAIPLTELRQVDWGTFTGIIFVDAAGKKYSYGIRRPEDKEKLKQLFASYMK